jgi:hypothetical protein
LTFGFFSAAVVDISDGAVSGLVIFDVFLTGNHIPTLTAPNETGKREVVIFLGVGVAALAHHPLHLIKKFL